MNEGCEIRMVPIDAVVVLNPRLRNMRVFRELVASIAHLGLKKPITVSQRPDVSGYELVCGQGRLEAFKALGQAEIPAIIREASQEDCFVMSIAENVARRRHAPLELIGAIGALKEKGYSHQEIATKVDFGADYVTAICQLLDHGEEKLICAVECGVIPVTIAIEIAQAKERDAQRALLDAYKEKGISGSYAFAIKKIIEQRNRNGKRVHGRAQGLPHRPKLAASQSLMRAFQRETERQKLLIKRAGVAQSRLRFVTCAMKKLLADEHFVALLRADGLSSLPCALVERIASGGQEP